MTQATPSLSPSLSGTTSLSVIPYMEFILPSTTRQNAKLNFPYVTMSANRVVPSAFVPPLSIVLQISSAGVWQPTVRPGILSHNTCPLSVSFVSFFLMFSSLFSTIFSILTIYRQCKGLVLVFFFFSSSSLAKYCESRKTACTVIDSFSYFFYSFILFSSSAQSIRGMVIWEVKCR